MPVTLVYIVNDVMNKKFCLRKVRKIIIFFYIFAIVACA